VTTWSPARLIVAFAAATAACAAPPSDQAALRPQPAVDVILRAFEQHRLVGVSDGAGHGELESLDLFTTLIRDHRFSRTVRNIVIEFGNARYQPILDRYVLGEPVTRDELRRVWEDTTQVSGIWSLPMYEQMLAVTRAVNATLPAPLRIRILAGDPPIDWGAVTGPADEDMNDWRDAHFAHVVERAVMLRGQNALLWIGGAHITRNVIFPNSLIHLLDRRFPGQTWVVGVLDAARVRPDVSARLNGWTLPAGASVRNTWLGNVDVDAIGFALSRPGAVEDNVDALLLLTSAPPHRQDPPPLDAAYAGELARRRALGRATLPFRGATIRFEENRATFTAEANDPLQAVLEELLRDRDLRLSVKAFADRTEPDADRLAFRRAELVIDWLTARGAHRDRLVPTGCGARRPLSFGNTAADRAMNRRAELVRMTPTAGCEPPW
jgi:outer membrane protein OmpA-like peptidoglycan-associated protein